MYGGGVVVKRGVVGEPMKRSPPNKWDAKIRQL